MKIDFIILCLCISQNLSKSVVTKFSVNKSKNERAIEEELLKTVAKNREYKERSKNIIKESNELNEKIESKALILNIEKNGLFFENRSVLESCSSNDSPYQNFQIQSTIKKKISDNAKYFYLKKMKLINKLLIMHNKKSKNEKFKKITFHKKNSHKFLVYNLELSEKFLKSEMKEKNKNRLVKINKILKKQLLLYYLDKKFRKSEVFAIKFDPKELQSKKIFINWVNSMFNNQNFDQIMQQAKRYSTKSNTQK